MLKVAFLGPQLVSGTLVPPGQLVQVGTVLVRLDQTQQLVPSIAIGSVAEMITVGGWLGGGGGEGGRTVMLTGRETVTALLLSVADRKSTRLNSSHLGISYAV